MLKSTCEAGNSGFLSRPSSFATRNATDFDLMTSISVFMASPLTASVKGEIGFLNGGIDLSLRVKDEYLDSRFIGRRYYF